MNNLGYIQDAKDIVTLEYLQGRYAGGNGSNPYLNLAYLNDNLRGKNGGLAPLDDKGKVPMAHIPDTILGQVLFGGTVRFANNILTATVRGELKAKLGISASTIVVKNSATGDYGYQQLDTVFFLAENDFDFAGHSYQVGDWLISIGTSWQKIDNTDAVKSVAGYIGDVTADNLKKALLLGSLAYKNGIAYNDLTTKPTSEQIQGLLGNYITTFGGNAGAITLRSGSTTRGDVNFSITSGNELQGVVVLADWAKAENRPAYKYGDSDLTGFGSAATKNTDFFAEKTQLTDGSVTKVGTANVGSASQPMYLKAGVPTAITGAIANDTTGDAGTVGGLAESRFFRKNIISGSADCNTMEDNSFTILNKDAGQLTCDNKPNDADISGGYGVLTVRHGFYRNQIFFPYNSSNLFVRHSAYTSGQTTWQDWQVLYHSGNSNLTSVNWKAKALTLAGSITGATSITMNGALSGATAISASGSITITRTDTANTEFAATNTNGSIALLTATSRGVYDRTKSAWVLGTNGTNTWLSQGNVGMGTDTPTYKLDVNGTARATALKIGDGDATLTWDADASAWKLDGNLYATGFISAGGLNNEGGGGSAYERLDKWENYDASKGQVLSALLGKSLKDDVESLKGGSATSVVTTGSGNAVTAVSKSGTTITFTKGSTFLTEHQDISGKLDKTGGVMSGAITPSGDNTIDFGSKEKEWHYGYFKRILRLTSITASDTYNTNMITIPAKAGTMALTSDIPTSLPASDVYAWAKAENKPQYKLTEVLPHLVAEAMDENTVADGVYNTGTAGNTSSNVTNGPVASGHTLFSYTLYAGGTDIRKTQFALDRYGMGYIRGCKSGTWTNWFTLYTTGNKPTKSDVGLGNVDNTADANKSVNYATSAGKATNDESGNNIVKTYATKTQLTDGSVTKVGTANVGSASQPMYLKAGVPTAITGAIANDTTGNAATATALNREVLSDLNNATKYRVFESASNTPTNSPLEKSWSNGITFALNNNSQYRTQLVLTEGGRLYTRGESGGKWGNWVKIYGSNNSNKTDVDWSAKALTLAGSISGVTTISASGDIATERTDTGNIRIKSANKNGSISLLMATNKGIYDDSKASWIVATDGTNTWLPQGNVGVGITTPNEKFHVKGGNVLVDSNDGTLAIYTVETTYGHETMCIQSSFDSQNPITSQFPTTFSSRCIVALQPRGGCVGVGMTNPTETFQVNGTAKVNTLKIGNVTLSTDTDGNLKIDGNAYTTGFMSAGGLNNERQTRGFVTETFTTTAGVYKEIDNLTGSTNVCVSLYKGNALVYAEVEVTASKIKVKTEQSQTLKAVIISID